MMAEADILRVSADQPWTRQELIETAARAVGKVDLWGRRGLTGLNMREIEAMAGTLVLLGLVAVAPGAATPATLIVTKEKPDDQV